ncbi:sensor histidine kinase [Demequina lignilytica]|uniref:Histidine kinase/HSP90-like ATPase domain-containing protein n=1 Tax=Demequina lignilytica TaxID=3051663 RepID=A0AB35MHQ8_9MICO|nr:ATP-binding protein [Demequina sp. SYSU T0a273]MDN4483308.1 hypothetical protein [Demequina sp. SYSU T0a273]
MIGVDADGSARDRIRRTLLLAVGLGAIVFGALLASGGSGFLAQIPQLRAPYGWLTVVVGIVLPALLIVLHRVLPQRALLIYAGAISATFLVLETAWPWMMLEPTLADDATPWMQGINAVHATMAAIVWPRIVGWVYPLALGPIVAFVQVQVRDGAGVPALLDGLGAIIFSLILCGVSIAMIRAGGLQDAAAQQARDQAALEARRHTRELEQARINGIVHDDVMSVLLAASREDPPDGLKAQARHALDRVASLESGGTEHQDYDLHEFVAVVRSTVASIAPSLPVTYTVEPGGTLAAPVVAAFAEAAGEAVRNVLRHAGDDAAAHVSVDARPGAVRVTVRDSGAGFSTARISQRRLGIRVSIEQRMASVEGGSAHVTSTPGRGTTVELAWSAA